MPWLILAITGGVGYLLGRKGNPIGSIGEDVGSGVAKSIQPLLLPIVVLGLLAILFLKER